MNEIRPRKRGLIFIIFILFLFSMMYASGVVGTLVTLYEDIGALNNREGLDLVSKLYTQIGITFAVPTIVLLYLFKKISDIYFYQKKLIAIQKLVDSNQVSIAVATNGENLNNDQLVSINR